MAEKELTDLKSNAGLENPIDPETNEPTKKELSHGKKIGLAAFIISEIIVIILILNAIYMTYLGKVVSENYIGQILLFQGTVFSVSWAAKASSNFVVKDK